jgi:hypothetical protein
MSAGTLHEPTADLEPAPDYVIAPEIRLSAAGKRVVDVDSSRISVVAQRVESLSDRQANSLMISNLARSLGAWARRSQAPFQSSSDSPPDLLPSHERKPETS